MEGASKIMETYQETVENVTNFSETSSGIVKLGLSPLFGTCFLGDILPDFSEAYPNIKINIIEDRAKKMDELVEKGEVDTAVTLSASRPPPLAAAIFSTQRNVALLHKSHPLPNAETLTAAKLRDELSQSSIGPLFCIIRSLPPVMPQDSGPRSRSSVPSGISWLSSFPATAGFPSSPNPCWTSAPNQMSNVSPGGQQEIRGHRSCPEQADIYDKDLPDFCSTFKKPSGR